MIAAGASPLGRGNYLPAHHRPDLRHVPGLRPAQTCYRPRRGVSEPRLTPARRIRRGFDARRRASSPGSSARTRCGWRARAKVPERKRSLLFWSGPRRAIFPGPRRGRTEPDVRGVHVGYLFIEFRLGTSSSYVVCASCAPGRSSALLFSCGGATFACARACPPRWIHPAARSPAPLSPRLRHPRRCRRAVWLGAFR